MVDSAPFRIVPKIPQLKLELHCGRCESCDHVGDIVVGLHLDQQLVGDRQDLSKSGTAHGDLFTIDDDESSGLNSHDSSSSVGASAVTGAGSSTPDPTEGEPPSLADLADDLARVVEGLRGLAAEQAWGAVRSSRGGE